MPASPPARIRVRAYAKINLTLRVLGRRPDGFHDLLTLFQSIALHDTLTFERAAGPLSIVCDDPACPSNESNLVWKAAEAVWRAGKRRGSPAGVRIRIAKQIPMEAGLGGGSADAAAALRACNRLWRVGVPDEELESIGARVGADVPFLIEGGTALGVARGDVIYRLPDVPRAHVVLVVPPFGVSTKDAYLWWDRRHGFGRGRPQGRAPVPMLDLRNDLQEPVAAHHAEIARLVRDLGRAGASHAAMTGSGSAVFGLFGSAVSAQRAARWLAAADRRVIVTATRGRVRAPA